MSKKSVEPDVADLFNGMLKSYSLDYRLEQAGLTPEIDEALANYDSKGGGRGGNRPDVKLLLINTHGEKFPVLIEYKGLANKLVKLNTESQVDNTTAKNEPNYKNIKDYAVNGAVHYANAILHYTTYTEVIAIGVTGYKDVHGNLHHEMGVYLVSKKNLGVGQEIGKYEDFSFLARNHFDNFVDKFRDLHLTTEQLEAIKEKKEREIDASLMKINNDIFNNEKGLSESDRVYLVASCIMATLGADGVSPLTKEHLDSSQEPNDRDGDRLLRKIGSFLIAKEIPEKKRDQIINTLKNTLTTDHINSDELGDSQLKRVFCKIVDDLGIYYKIGLTTDFTGKLFNEMYRWLGFSQDQANDVVLTPSYVSKLLVKLAEVNRDSYVWDFATGSAGLLVSAMNEMLIDASKIGSPEERYKKEAKIRAEQLLGIEMLPNVYMLAIINMILMGDGSSNIINGNSLKFDGNYSYGKHEGEKFPATAFVLNPPYSAPGNGMVFVEKALDQMSGGVAAIITQASTGTGKAKEYNRRILKNHTLKASIKMPMDLFGAKASVQTYVYVFEVNKPHDAKREVKFIDFSNDGYLRINRKKSSINLRNVDRAEERYQEIVDLVKYGKRYLNIFTEEHYYENTIDPESGSDWNQSAPINTRPTLDDLRNTVSEYLAWEVSNLLRTKEGQNLVKK